MQHHNLPLRPVRPISRFADWLRKITPVLDVAFLMLLFFLAASRWGLLPTSVATDGPDRSVIRAK